MRSSVHVLTVDGVCGVWFMVSSLGFIVYRS